VTKRNWNCGGHTKNWDRQNVCHSTDLD
jgi:hypothetical protein